MQLAGQICGQRPQATHLARPCSSVSMRCVPRQRDEIVQSLEDFSSGYCIVTFGRQMWLKVRAMPLSVARRYDVSGLGGLSTLTPSAACVSRVFRTLGSPVWSQDVNGMSHPPKNSVAISAEAVTMFEYSAI